MEFIVGRWYKISNSITYIKFEKIESGIFVASDDILHDKYDGRGGNYGNITQNIYELLEDLSEIQKYLPKDHPDILPIKEDIYLKQTLKRYGIR
jgi:hypothetical protein